MGCGIAKAIVIAVMVADIVAPRAVENKLPEPTTAVVETTTAWVPEETAPPQTATQWQNSFRRYRVNGVLPPYEWQWYLYGKLADRGLEWWYPYAVCQIYQESNWNQYSTNGKDHGLCQFKGIYWGGWVQAAGIPGADIWDVYAQLTVYAWMMGNNLAAAGGNVGQALSLYYLGYAGWSDEYIGHVMRWIDYLEVVE